MSRKGKLQHRKFLYWNYAVFWIFIQNITFHKLKHWLFICHMFKSFQKTIVQLNCMTCFWVDTIILTENSDTIMQKYVRYLVNKFTHNIYLVVSPFICRELKQTNIPDRNQQCFPISIFTPPILILLDLNKDILLIRMKCIFWFKLGKITQK